MRIATIDIGTNSVVLLVAEKTGRTFTPILERAEITRLGRGVDKTKTLSAEAISETVMAVRTFAVESRALGVDHILAVTTSAARDASNGHQFIDTVFSICGLKVEIISGEEEARLSFLSVSGEFGSEQGVVVLDIGGGSTEFIFGNKNGIDFRQSFNVGSVRMTERFIKSAPAITTELVALNAHLKSMFASVPKSSLELVAVAGTATTVCAMIHEVDPYDSKKIHGVKLSKMQILTLAVQLAALSNEEKMKLKGLSPKRADVILAGISVLLESMNAIGAAQVTISDRGLRWGLLYDRFGDTTA
jgi:exopolyphosphatase / guanosine-5'-triphosphate,3'-diphosphate pyrophosphatase